MSTASTAEPPSHTLVGDASAYSQLLTLLQEREHFFITSHARPDGDAIGSALGLMHLLEAMGKRVDVAFADSVPAMYHGLPGADRILPAWPSEQPDAAILLECDSVERSGFLEIPARFSINIDHHQSGRPFADWNWIEPHACAVGAMLYDFAVAMRLPLLPAAATCLYAAVLTDTGSFTFSCTTAATFALASHLVQCGADASGVAQSVYFNNPQSKVRILGTALNRMTVEGPLAWTTISLEDIAAAGAAVADCEGVVNYLIGIAGVQAAAVLRETADGLHTGGACRVSMRGKGLIDVARVAEQFGGGGHQHASGCTVRGAQQHAVNVVLEALRTALPL